MPWMNHQSLKKLALSGSVITSHVVGIPELFIFWQIYFLYTKLVFLTAVVLYAIFIFLQIKLCKESIKYCVFTLRNIRVKTDFPSSINKCENAFEMYFIHLL